MPIPRTRLLMSVCMLICLSPLCYAQGPVVIDPQRPGEGRTTIQVPGSGGMVIDDEESPVELKGDPYPAIRVTVDGKAFAEPSFARLVDDRHILCEGWSLLRALRAYVTHAEDWSWIRGDLGSRYVAWKMGDPALRTQDREIRTAATPLMIEGKPFIPLVSTANNLGCRVDWDRNTMTANIRTPSKMTLTAFKITDLQIEWPVLRRLPGGYMLLSGRVMKAGQPRLFCAEGGPHGDSWRSWDLPLPTGMDPNGRVGGWAMGDDFVLCHGGMDVRPDQPGAFPLWCGGVGKSWAGSVVRGSPPVAYREVRALAVAHDRAEFMIAAGVEYTRKSDMPYGTWRLWRTDDSGLTWRVISVNGQDGFGSVEIEAVNSLRTVWSWANSVGKNHLIRSDVYSDAAVATPAGFSDALVVSVPDWQPVYLVWAPSTAPNAPRRLSYSPDRGATWQELETSFWPVTAMDWYDWTFGMVYADSTVRSLYWTHDQCGNWFRHRMDDWQVLDRCMIVRSNLEAYMVAQRANSADQRLHCLRWELGW